ncbi:MAG: LTA synthase family protein [Dongiaceae bacterium]
MIGWLALAVALAGILVEGCTIPVALPAPRPARALASAGFALALAGLLLLLGGRPVSAAIAAVALMAAVVAVSNAKHRAIREPLVFVDFAMLGQVLRHPHVFITWVGVLASLAAAAALAGAVAAAVLLETPLPGWLGDHTGGRLGLLLAVLAGLAALPVVARRPLVAAGWALRPSLDARTDVERFGLLGTLLLTTLLSLDGAPARPAPVPRTPAGPRPAGPSVVAVQLESFFDVRLMDRRIAPGLLPCFDACGAGAVQRGRLEVPAWGYTQRSEFAFLTGLDERALGVDRFNPYARFARRPVWSIAHELRARGYRTVCIHPFHGTFFGRDQVVANLGFDRFLDIAAFAGAPHFGPYVADAAIADKVIELLGEPGPPLFVFVITIESHGTFRRGRLPAHELAKVGDGLADLTEPVLSYLRHLVNADRMIGRLAARLEQAGDGVLCCYGDHLPSFPALFRRNGYRDGRTDYLIWRPGHDRPPELRDIGIRSLSGALLATVDAAAGAAQRSVASMSA